MYSQVFRLNFTEAPSSLPAAMNAGLESIAVGPRPISLREMMRRAVRSANQLNNSHSSDQPSVQQQQQQQQQHAYGSVQEEPIPTHSWPPESFEVTSGDEDSLMGLGGSAGVNNKTNGGNGNVGSTLIVDPAERRSNAMQILHTLLYEMTFLQPHLVELLCAK